VRFGARIPRRKNPETAITRQIRELLKLMRVPHFKHWGGPMGEKGIPDIIGTLPGETGRGRGLFIEVKTPRGSVQVEQDEFLARMRNAGAVAFVARGPSDLISKLKAAGFEPAARIGLQ